MSDVLKPNAPGSSASVAYLSASPGDTGGLKNAAERVGARKRNGHNSNTTAVLSVGEADMLLMHSPYHQEAWQDTLRSSSPDRDTMNPFALGRPYTGPSGVLQDQWNLSATSASVERQSRRHTTGVLTQRNYQVILIIYNKISVMT